MVLDTSPPLAAESLFDGNATTGVMAERDGSAAIRLELGSTREVVGLGVHGTGRAKIALYAEEGGERRPISTGRDGAIKLERDQWTQVIPAAASKTSTLVVQWTASPEGPATITELALWVAGRARSALAEAAIADRLVTELPENALSATASPWSAPVARVTPKGPVSASFELKLNRDPLLGRAFLVYELDKKAHWTGVARTINGHVVRGGYRADAKGLGGVQVEEINPAWLKSGQNTISFQPTRMEDGRGYSVRDVRVVGVPRGAEPVFAPGPRTQLSDGDLATGVGGPGIHTASLSGPAEGQPAFLSFHLDKPTRGTLTVSAKAERGHRKAQVSVDLDGRAAGWQAIPVAGVLPASAELRVRVVGDRESTGQVSEARVQAFPALTSPADLTVSYPLHGECHDHKTYVRGFVSQARRLQNPQLFVDGQPTTGKIDADGSFEVDVPEPAAAQGRPWSIRLDVAAEGGGHHTRTVPVDICVEPPKGRIIGVSPPVEDVGAPYGAVVSPQKASKLSFAGATIDIPAGAVEGDVRVTMRALDRGQLPPVQAEMDDVSTSAMRFGPHGLKFNKPVKVTLAVDPGRMPPGMTQADVVGFFFDEASSRWTQLPTTPAGSDRIVAETTHFTDFIAATVRTPDHPDMQQFNPNTMKGVKVGEPGAGITMIEPPEANSSGSARLSYPIETPPARNGIGPELALNYDSDRVSTNGWLGVGWDLRLSSIEIDTRFGVPRYDGTEIYLLDGAPLARVGTTSKYVRRVEGPFDQIERVGTGPTGYSWKVTDKSGTVYTYGTVANSRLANPRAGQSANIFRWYLERVQDAFGNFMTITYQHDNHSVGTTPNVETYDEVYPSVIDYTGGPSLAAHYHVEFKLDTAGTRPDTTITARPGFLVSTRRRLIEIDVKSGTTLVRRYVFQYQSNLADTLQKSVLQAVALRGGAGDAASELYRHTFEYNKAPPPGSPMFTQEQTWGQVWQTAPPPQSGFVPRREKRLSHSVDSLVGGGITLGVGFPYIMGTGTFGGGYGSSITDLAFLGLTGQGMPDQFDGSGTLSQNDLLFPQQNNHFSARALGGVSELGGVIGATNRLGWTAGGNISAMGGLFGGGASYGRYVQDEFKIVTDMNGDGFPDIAYQTGGTVHTYINDGNRNFTPKQWTGYSLADSPFSTAARVADANVTNATFRTSPLIRWVAPFAGTVTVNSQATIGNPYGDMQVELYVANDPVRSDMVDKGVTGTRVLASNYVRAINAGDKIYMRAVGLNGQPGPGSATFGTTIVYAPPSGSTAADHDPAGRPIFTYDTYDDYPRDGFSVLVPWHLTADGDVGVARCFSKVQTADEINVAYVLRNPNGGVAKRVDLTTPASAGTTCFPNTAQLPQSSSDSNMAMFLDVTQDQSLALEFTADTPGVPVVGTISPVRPANGRTMMYTSYCRLSAPCEAPQSTGSGYTIPGDPFSTSFPVPAADIASDGPPYYQNRIVRVFNNGTTTMPQPMRTVVAPSSSVSFSGTLRPNATLTEDVFVLVQGVNKLLKKLKIPAGSTTGQTFSVAAGPLTVGSGEPLFFSIHSTSVIGGNVSWVPGQELRMNGVAVPPLRINHVIRDVTFDNNPSAGVTSRDPMSGGYHNWFYGDWNDSVPFCDHQTSCANPIVRTTAPPQNNDRVMGMVPRRVTVPGVFGQWQGRGGAQMYSTGAGGNPHLWPGMVNGLAATATNATSMSGLRVSDTWNLNLSANAFGATAGLNAGDSTTQVDFFDFNGDRFPDSITNYGVQYNDGTSAFSARQNVDMSIGGSTEIRRIQNVALQAGVTVTGDSSRQLITEAQGDGETKKISATAALSASADYGVSSTRIDFADVNGDGLIDHVREEPTDSSLRVRLNLGYGFSKELAWARTGSQSGWTQGNASVNTGWPELLQYVSDTASVLNQLPTNAKSPASTNVVRLQDTGTLSGQVGGSLFGIGGGGGPTYSVTRTWVDMLDVNGDGLPDQVLKVPGDPNLRVKLNMGDRFAPEQWWELPNWTTSPGTSYGFLAPDGVAFSTIDGWGRNLSFLFCVFGCFGASGYQSDSKGGPSMQFEDVDGDGDLDQVMKVPGNENVYAKLNKVVNTDPTGGAALGPPNLLTRVNRPLGGRIDIAYSRSGNRVELQSNPKINMPSNQWVMSRAVLRSGALQTWNADITRDFTYANFAGYGSGYYDPVERENLGFANVKTIYPDEDVGKTSIAVIYLNQNYYLRGLEYFRYWYQNDTDSILLRSTEVRYTDPSGKSPEQQPARTGTFFPAPTTSYTRFFERQLTANTHTVSRTFDTNGNLTDVIDYGDQNFQGFNDDFHYRIGYKQIGTAITVPETITVRTGSTLGQGTLLAKRVAAFSTRPKPDSVTDVIANGKHPSSGTIRTEGAPGNATWSFTYDSFGNVRRATSPNSTVDPDGSARTLEYAYDTSTQTYPITTTQFEPSDATLQYSASAVYDLRFGLPTRIIDVAGAKQEIDYDSYGRVTKVFAPVDFNSTGGRIDTNAPTIGVTYSQVAHTVGATEPVPAWAMATHRSKTPNEGGVPGATLPTKSMRTVTFVDGLTRSLQVKKDITRDDGSGTATATMSVSGQTIFDARGRVYRQGQPTFASASTPTSFVSVGMINPTEFAYDVLGRLRKEQHPDNGSQATTRIDYQRGVSPKDGREWIVKITTDPLYDENQSYHFRMEYRTARDHMRLLSEPTFISGTPTNLYTAYEYDPLGRVVKVTDAKNNETSAEYDTVGNLVKLTSPDAGIREWRYCVGGYLCAEQSPKACPNRSPNVPDNECNVQIQYSYDRDRLTGITYPNAAGTTSDPIGNPPVAYVYGNATTDKGAAGGYKSNRVKRRTDEAGQFDYAYDALGNVASETALLRRTSMTNYDPYQTQYTWDAFGRLIDVRIPATSSTDPLVSTPAETIRYGYDAGGAVTSAWGKIGTSAAVPYVKHVGYNEFGERTRITYGNDVFSRYGYAPDTRRLTTADTYVQPTGQSQRRAQALVYSYDRLGNVTYREQSLPKDTVATNVVPIGGQLNQWFYYDPLNQLFYTDMFSQVKTTLSYYANVYLTYDEIGNITGKWQNNYGDNYDQAGNWIGSFTGPNNYVFTPSYSGSAHNPSPHAATTIAEDRLGTLATRSLGYDRNGNLLSATYSGGGKYIRWTDTDRVRSICEGLPARCVGTSTADAEARYAADGTRTHNKVTQGTTTKETLYVNQFLTIRNGTLPTKHVYLGDARVASKVESSSTLSRTYWYHSDHLQSAQYVSTSGQALVQHLEYFPSGEIWLEENDMSRLGWSETSHASAFTGKEMDPSGYYYFGARYYEPQIQMWLSPDPALADYVKLSGHGRAESSQKQLPSHGLSSDSLDVELRASTGRVHDVSQSRNLALYTYSWNNPVVHVDPDGERVVFAAGSTRAFKAEYRRALQYLRAAGAAGVLTELQRRREIVTLKEGTSLSDVFFVGSGVNELTWNPYSALETAAGGKQSPALGLLHEADHALQEFKNPTRKAADRATSDPAYGNLEEKRVITGSERRAARKLHEATRSDHNSGREYRVRHSDRR